MTRNGKRSRYAQKQVQPLADRLPRQVSPATLYVNAVPGQPLYDWPAGRGPGEFPKVLAVYDGGNDQEVAQLVGWWSLEMPTEVLALDLDNFHHIGASLADGAEPGEAPMMGLSVSEAYERDGSRWRPSSKLVDLLASLFEEEKVPVLREQAA